MLALSSSSERLAPSCSYFVAELAECMRAVAVLMHSHSCRFTRRVCARITCSQNLRYSYPQRLADSTDEHSSYSYLLPATFANGRTLRYTRIHLD